MSKNKTCFKILVKKSFRWHLETWEKQIGSIFKLNIKKIGKFQKKIGTIPPELAPEPAPEFAPPLPMWIGLNLFSHFDQISTLWEKR